MESALLLPLKNQLKNAFPVTGIYFDLVLCVKLMEGDAVINYFSKGLLLLFGVACTMGG